ncbi:MAG: hypothetical protein AAGE59_34420 [Cyanobacteria bacterium P01_F01_bin.86]
MKEKDDIKYKFEDLYGEIKQLDKLLSDCYLLDELIHSASEAFPNFADDCKQRIRRLQRHLKYLMNDIDGLRFTSKERLYNNENSVKEEEYSKQASSMMTTSHALGAEGDVMLRTLETASTGIDPRGKPLNQAVQNAASKATDWVKNTLMPLIKSIAAQVWQVISSLLTPKEWKIKGSVGTPLLGLANVELEITFGK